MGYLLRNPDLEFEQPVRSGEVSLICQAGMCEGKELATDRRSVVTAERVEDIKYKKA